MTAVMWRHVPKFVVFWPCKGIAVNQIYYHILIVMGNPLVKSISVPYVKGTCHCACRWPRALGSRPPTDTVQIIKWMYDFVIVSKAVKSFEYVFLLCFIIASILPLSTLVLFYLYAFPVMIPVLSMFGMYFSLLIKKDIHTVHVRFFLGGGGVLRGISYQ